MATRTRKSSRRKSTTTRRTKSAPRRQARRSAPAREAAPTRKAASTVQTAHSTTDWLATQTLRTVNTALSSVEHGADLTYRTLQQLTGTKRGNWLETWRGWATHFNPQDLMNMAQHTATVMEKDMNRFAHNVARTIRKRSNTLVPASDELMRDARRNVSRMYHRFEQSPWMTMAKGMMGAGRQEILNMLDIPSQEEVEQLERKVNTLEQRLTTLMLRGARNR